MVIKKSLGKKHTAELLATEYAQISEHIMFQGVKTNNLKNIDLMLPKNAIITITGVSGSGKSSLAFDTIYKEGQFRYIESLSSYLRQFFNLGERPNIEHCSGLSPAIAIEQNKRGGNNRSTVGTLTELDDYIRLLFAKVGDGYCYNCGNPIKPQTVEQIITQLQEQYFGKRIYLLKESGTLHTKVDLQKFVKNNKQKVEKGTGFTRYLLVASSKEDTESGKLNPIEYFYLEEPTVPEKYFPLQGYGIYDRITIEEQKIPRLKEDIIKILGESKKFGVWVSENFGEGNQRMSENGYIGDRSENGCREEACPLPNDKTVHDDGTNTELLGNSNIEISIEKKKTSANNTTDRKIVEIGNNEYDNIIALWEGSIRATHHFVLEKDIDFYKQLIHKNLGKVKLYAIKDKDNKMLAFMGTSGDKIEMLFVHPKMMRKGLGTLLIKYAINDLHLNKLDVNEQNKQAITFYQKMGFGMVSRSELNDEGKPYPLLHLALMDEIPSAPLYERGEIHRFTDKMFCPNCNITYPEFTTQHFSPNRQEGACPHCHGIGEVLQVDFEKIIEPTSPLKDAVLPRRDSNLGQAILRKLCEKYAMNLEKPRAEQPERFLHIVMNGDNELLRVPSGGKWTSMYYQGMEEIIKEQYAKGLLTVDFQAMLNMKPCPECFGSKLKKESLHVFLTFPKQAKKLVEGLPHFKKFFIMQEALPFTHPINDGRFKINIWDLQKIPLSELGKLITLYVQYTQHPQLLIERITRPLLDRISTIEELGLAYLMTIRQIDTLSGGEIQRLRLAKQLGNKLTGIVYVLDEPTIGLDSVEIEKAIIAIRKLKAMGNTIVVVEHNEEFIQASDWVVEIGPGAGDFGGELVFNGPYQEFLKSDALTAKYLRGEKQVHVNFEHTPTKKRVKIFKASKHNLQHIDVSLNLGSFTVITGSSGAGKTTLMYTTLYRFLNDKEKFVQSYIRLQLLKKGLSREEILSAPVMRAEEYHHFENLALQEFYKDLAVENIQGYEEIANTIYVDQTSIGKTPRSCPATFVSVFDKIRMLYAGTTEAKYLGFNNSYFSFNSDKGACPACNGYGYKKIELQFLPDTYVPCELCHGKRYKPEILAIKRRGKTIAEVLDMYISDALAFFHEIDHITEELQLMCDIGLGYLKMGQSAHTLSGGESQRLKLVKHLLKDYRGHSVYFLDEPTVGLHMQDIEKLLRVLKVFLERGDTILMIEHDQNILQYADHIIRLENGKVVE